MKIKYKKVIIILLIIIFLLSIMLYFEIKRSNSYNKELYEKAMQEYDDIISNNKIRIIKKYISKTQKEIIEANKEDETIGIITIPKIDISYPIMAKYSEENLRIAPTKYTGVNPHEIGNMVIVGHNYWNKKQFSNLKRLEIGDFVEIKDKYNLTINYRVYGKYEIDQSDFTYLNQNTNGKREITLITCIKNKKNRRLVLKCIEE